MLRARDFHERKPYTKIVNDCLKNSKSCIKFALIDSQCKYSIPNPQDAPNYRIWHVYGVRAIALGRSEQSC